MAGRKTRRRVTVGYGKARVSFEWMGFRDGGTLASLTTATTDFEIVPPASAGGIGISDSTVYRIVGQIGISNQAGVVTRTALGMGIVLSPVGEDQTSDLDWSPRSTDIDAQDENGVMWWYVAPRAGPEGPAADYDTSSLVLPIDIRVKRRLQKRDRIVLRAVAGSANVLEIAVNLRALVRTY